MSDSKDELLEPSKPSQPAKLTFWKRQFSGQPTPAQTRFDVLLGILLPIFCLLADPIVFRGYDSVLTRYRWVAYTFIGVEIAIVGLWLLLRSKLARGAIFFGAPLLGGGAFAMAIGVGILPASLPGLLVLIGILGFTPFATAVVFFRNGVRALRQARHCVRPWVRAVVIVAGLVFIGTPSLFILNGYYRETLPHLLQEAATGVNGNSRMGRWIYQPDGAPGPR